MGSTHLSLHYHLIFATKNHEPLITAQWRPRLHAYLGGIISGLEAIPEIIGGVENHIHILAGLRATHCLADVLREIKSSSSKWVHEEIGLSAFSWQEGYGAFTVSPSQLEIVANYIAEQEKHHRRVTFKEEYLRLLKHYGLDGDDRYLWD